MKVYTINLKRVFNYFFWGAILIIAILFGFKVAIKFLIWALLILFVILPLLVFIVLMFISWYFKRKLHRSFKFNFKPKKKVDDDAIDVEAKVVK